MCTMLIYVNLIIPTILKQPDAGSMMAVLPGVKSKADIEKAWSTVDRNGASVLWIILFHEYHPTEINIYICM